MSVNCTLVNLLDALQEVTAKWYEVGLRLGIPPRTLDIIKANSPHEVEHCMREMLKWWIGKYPEWRWDAITQALRAVDRNDVANKVAKMYCDSTDSISLGMLYTYTILLYIITPLPPNPLIGLKIWALLCTRTGLQDASGPTTTCN